MNLKKLIEAREGLAPREKDKLLVSKDIFRAYDIRGKYPEEINSEVFNQIGLALGARISSKNSDPVIICRDGRISSKELSDALVSALVKCGIEVIDIGELPTPLMNFSLRKSKIKNGLMVTGSHNPKNYNGVKMVIDDLTIYGEHIQELYNLIEKQDFSKTVKKGSYLKDTSIADNYIKHLKENIKIKTDLKVVIDCSNGITGPLVNNICKSFDLDYKIINESVDGTFPNHPPDPTNPKNLIQIIKVIHENKADLGIAFDGDGDRIILVKNDGEIIWPDQLMIIFSKQILKSQKGKIVFDIKCSKHLNDSILKSGGEPVVSRTGHSFIKKSMIENNAILGGEMSGHIFFNDKWFGFDDGMYAFLRIMEILSNEKDYNKIFDELPRSLTTPELSIEFKKNNHFNFMNKFVKLAEFDNCQKIDIDGLKVIYDDGWGLIRCSNTTSCLVLRFEADDKNSMNRIKSKFRDAMLKIDKNLEIPF